MSMNIIPTTISIDPRMMVPQIYPVKFPEIEPRIKPANMMIMAIATIMTQVQEFILPISLYKGDCANKLMKYFISFLEPTIPSQIEII